MATQYTDGWGDEPTGYTDGWGDEPKKAVGVPVKDGRIAAKSVYPDLDITDNVRPLNSPLGRKNPKSKHVTTNAGIDARPIPGMTFEDYVNGYRNAGYDVLEAIDEVKNPSKHATGPHWHVVLGQGKNTYTDGWGDTQGAPEAAVKGVNNPVPGPPPADYALRVRTSTPNATVRDVTEAAPDPTQTIAGYGEEGLLAERNYNDYFIKIATDPKMTWEKAKPLIEKGLVPGEFWSTDIAGPNRTPEAVWKSWFDFYKAGGQTPIDFNRGNQRTVTEAQTEGSLNPEQVSRPEALSAENSDRFREAVSRNIEPLRNLMTEGRLRTGEEKAADDLSNELYWADQNAESSDNAIERGVSDFAAEVAADPLTYVPFIGQGKLASKVAGTTIGRMGVGAAELGTLDMARQGAMIAAGAQDELDPTQTVFTAALGAGFEGVFGKLGKRETTFKADDGSELFVRSPEGSPTVIVSDKAPELAKGYGTSEKRKARGKAAYTKATAENEVVRVTQGWENAPEVIVYPTAAAFKKAEPDRYAQTVRDGAQKSPGFLGEDGKIRVIVPNVKKDQLPALIYHEALGHVGLANKLGDEIDDVLMKAYNENWKIRKDADAYGERVRAYDNDADPIARYVEEVLAGRSEKGPLPASIRDKLRGIFRKYGEKIPFINKNLRYNDADVRNLLRSAHRTVTGEGPQGAPSGQRYMMIGARGEANLRGAEDGMLTVFKSDSHEEAIRRAEAGEDASSGSQIRKDTGWFFGPDRRWRTELDDSAADWAPEFKSLSSQTKTVDELNYVIKDITGSKTLYLSEVLDHPELFKAYPEMEDFKVLFTKGRGDLGSYDEANKVVRLNLDYPETSFKTLIHEVQHGVQGQEDFARGGNSLSAIQRLPDDKLIQVAERKIKDNERKIQERSSEDALVKSWLSSPEAKALKEAFDEKERIWALDPSGVSEAFFRAFKKYNELNINAPKFFGKERFGQLSNEEFRAYNKLFDIVEGGYEDDLVSASLRKENKDLSDRLTMVKDWGEMDSSTREYLRRKFAASEHIPYQAYEHLFGEVEARDTANRLNLTKEQRQSREPYKSESWIEPNDYIVHRFETIKNKYMMADETGGRERRANRAGSINLDKVYSAEDIDMFIADVAKQQGKSQMSWEEIEYDAKTMGLTVGKLMKKRIQENSALGVAMMQTFVKSAENVAKLSKKIASGNGTMKDEGDLIVALTRHAAIQAKVGDFRSDVGRALNAMKMTIGAQGRVPKELFDNIGALNLADRNNLYQMAKMIDEAGNDPKKLNKLANDAFKPYPEDYIIGYGYSSMLYSLGSQFTNGFGTVGNIIQDTMAHWGAAGIGKVRQMLLGSVGKQALDRVTIRELAARKMGALHALFSASTYKDAGESFMMGRPKHQVSKVEVGHNLFSDLGKTKGGKVGEALGMAVDLPSKGLATADSFARSHIEMAATYGLAHRQALSEGLTGPQYWDRVDELIANPTPEMVKMADTEAAVTQLVDDPTPIGRLFDKFKSRPAPGTDGGKAGAQRAVRFAAQLIVPFARVSDRIIMWNIRQIPLAGFLDRHNRADFMAGGARRDLVFARMAIGGAILGYLYQKADDGELSGVGPDNYAERDFLQSTGWQPNSIKLSDGQWHPLKGLDQITIQAKIVAEFVRRQKAGELSDEGAVSESLKMLKMVSSSMMDQQYIGEIAKFFSAASGNDPMSESNFENYVAGKAQSFVPAAVRQGSEIADGKVRDSTGDGTLEGKTVGRLKASFPNTRQELPVRRDVLGRETESHKNILGFDQASPERTDPVTVELKRLYDVTGKALMTGADRGDIKAVVGENADAALVQRYRELVGAKVTEVLGRLIAVPAYKNATDEVRAKEVTRYIGKARKAAREEFKAEQTQTYTEGW